MTTEHSVETSYESRLTDGTDRFVAHMIEHAFAIGRRSSRDFLRHFPPSAIMEALADSPTLRADILEAATGVRRKVALKKSAQSSGEDLQIALDEGEAAAEEVVFLFRPDDRVRYLPRAKLWAFLIEGEFWKTNKTDKTGYERAQLHLAFLLDRALKDQVVSHRDIIEGVTVSKICQLMPRTELETAMNSALAAGRNGQPFADRDLYNNLTSTTMANYIPLPHLWDEVVHPCVATEHGLTNTPSVTKLDAPVSQEDINKPVSANSNDQAVSAQARPLASKPTGPAPLVKRPQGVMPAASTLAASTPAAKPVVVVSKAPVTQDSSAHDEDEAFDVDFDNLTASKG